MLETSECGSCELWDHHTGARQLCLDQKLPWPSTAFKTEMADLTVGDSFDVNAAIAATRNALHFEGETTNAFKVPAKLAEPDPLIKAAADSVRADWQFYQMPHMLRADSGIISIRFSKKNWDRALRIMNTLVKIWRGRNYRISYHDKETKIYLREVSLSISLRETTTVTPSKDKYGSQTHTETGLLAFKVKGWSDREWKDGKVPLECHIQEICDHMEVSARDLENFRAEQRSNEQKERKEQQELAERIQSDVAEKQHLIPYSPKLSAGMNSISLINISMLYETVALIAPSFRNGSNGPANADAYSIP